MERSGLVPGGGVQASDLAKLVEATGPFVTVYLTTEADVENAGPRSELRWKDVRRELANAGAPEAALAAIDALVPEAHVHGQTLAVVANELGRLHVEYGPDRPPRDRAHFGPLPPLVPLCALRQGLPPYITVVADRTGADICAFRHGAEVAEKSVDGGTDPLAKSKPGGWSQLRYQRRAENTWAQNADDVVEELTSLVARFEAPLVVMAGDVRAVQLIRDALPADVLERTVVVEGSRAEDGSDERFAAAVQEQVTALVNNATVGVLAKFREELGQADRAADGPDDTLAALARAQVDVLLVCESPDDQRTAFFGPEPTMASRERSDLVQLGVASPTEAPLVDVAVRAALATGAAVCVIPNGDLPTGRLGALLRWS